MYSIERDLHRLSSLISVLFRKSVVSILNVYIILQYLHNLTFRFHKYQTIRVLVFVVFFYLKKVFPGNTVSYQTYKSGTLPCNYIQMMG